MAKSALNKTLKVTISGSFRGANKQIESFDNVTGVIPYLDDDKATQMVIRRYARIWVQQVKKCGPDGKPTEELLYKHVQHIRQVFIDSVDENPDTQLSYVGKNVMEMNFGEIQDFAAANDLSGVPLYKATSLTQARRMAFSEYAIKVLDLFEADDPKSKKPQNLYDHKVLGFNPNRFEPIIADGVIRRAGGHVADIEETLDREALALKGKVSASVSDPGKSRMTLEQLKAVADGRNISYHKSIGYDQLYKKIYSADAA